MYIYTLAQTQTMQLLHVTTMAKYSLLFFLILGAFFGVSTQSQNLIKCQNHRYNVIDYGAIGDGHSDDTKAFDDAWKATCQSSQCSSTMYIPSGRKFLLQPVIFSGNCNSESITVQIEGEIMAPNDPEAWQCNGQCNQWITFQHVDGLFINGSGVVNGQGSNWWKLDCQDEKDSKLCGSGKKATGFVVLSSKNVHINGLNFKDSPQMHIAFENSNWVNATNLHIQAPGDSPNTDGIHIHRSQNVYIQHSKISTGDDCVSIGDGSSSLHINNVICGPGHGISIGSLGKDGKEESVEFVFVKNVTFIEADNGVRIKTWQGGKGSAKNIIFEHIISENSANPIIIDQYYCPHKHCKNKTSAVQISNVTYTDIRGTSKTNKVVDLACSKASPCTDIFMKDINLQPSIDREEGEGGKGIESSENKVYAYCENVQGHSSGVASPALPCLSID